MCKNVQNKIIITDFNARAHNHTCRMLIKKNLCGLLELRTRRWRLSHVSEQSCKLKGARILSSSNKRGIIVLHLRLRRSKNFRSNSNSWRAAGAILLNLRIAISRLIRERRRMEKRNKRGHWGVPYGGYASVSARCSKMRYRSCVTCILRQDTAN